MVATWCEHWSGDVAVTNHTCVHTSCTVRQRTWTRPIGAGGSTLGLGHTALRQQVRTDVLWSASRECNPANQEAKLFQNAHLFWRANLEAKQGWISWVHQPTMSNYTRNTPDSKTAPLAAPVQTTHAIPTIFTHHQSMHLFMDVAQVYMMRPNLSCGCRTSVGWPTAEARQHTHVPK